jgi:energy-coupling factor transport system permease protein
MLVSFADRKSSLHPVFSVVFAGVILTSGLIMNDLTKLSIFLLGLTLLFGFFGFGLTVVRIAALVLPIAVGVGLLSVLIGEDTHAASLTTCRILLLGMCSVPTLMIQPSELSRSLNQIGIPRKITLALLITVRFVPVITGEVRRIQEAMRVRGVRFRWTNPEHAYRALVLPLLVRLINIADTLALSIETRGFSEQTTPSVFRKVNISWKDYAFSLLLLFLVAAIFYGVRS